MGFPSVCPSTCPMLVLCCNDSIYRQILSPSGMDHYTSFKAQIALQKSKGNVLNGGVKQGVIRIFRFSTEITLYLGNSSR